MIHQEFIEKFCPNYKERMAQLQAIIEEYCQQEPLTEREMELHETISILNEGMFDDALQNFANKICEAQRKECAESASIDWIDPFDFSAGHNGIDKKSILNADQPKIEEL